MTPMPGPGVKPDAATAALRDVNYVVTAAPSAIAKIRTKLTLDEEVVLQNYLRKGAPKPVGKARKAAKKAK